MPASDLAAGITHLYTSSTKEPAIIDVPPIRFLMVDGAGDPNVAPAYRSAVDTLFSLSYTLKFMLKKRGDGDYHVLPLEGLWWADDPEAFRRYDRARWQWTAMIAQPEVVTAADVEAARAEVRRKKAGAELAPARLETYHEGLAAQVLHIGPYAAEGPTIAALHAYITAHGYTLRGKHHEIYVGDPRRAAPEKLRAVIRQPIARL